MRRLPTVRTRWSSRHRAAVGSDEVESVVTTSVGEEPADGSIRAGSAVGGLEGLIQRRRALGIDTFDEVWEGSYHLAPAAHPAHGYVGTQLAVLWHPSLAPPATAWTS